MFTQLNKLAQGSISSEDFIKEINAQRDNILNDKSSDIPALVQSILSDQHHLSHEEKKTYIAENLTALSEEEAKKVFRGVSDLTDAIYTRSLKTSDIDETEKILVQDLTHCLHELNSYEADYIKSRFSKLPHNVIGDILVPYINNRPLRIDESFNEQELLVAYDSATLEKIMRKGPLMALFRKQAKGIESRGQLPNDEEALKFKDSVIKNGLRIQHLDLSDAVVLKPHLEEMIKACPNIQSLNLINLEIDFSNVSSFLENKPNLTYLALSISDSSSKLKISPELKENLSRLTVLRLLNSKIPDELIEAITDIPHLKTLDLTSSEYNLNTLCAKPSELTSLYIGYLKPSSTTVKPLLTSNHFNHLNNLVISSGNTPYADLETFIFSNNMPLLQMFNFGGMVSEGFLTKDQIEKLNLGVNRRRALLLTQNLPSKFNIDIP